MLGNLIDNGYLLNDPLAHIQQSVLMGMPELYKSSFDLEEFERFSLAKTLKKKKKKEEIETEEESEEETEEESESETETESESEDEY